MLYYCIIFFVLKLADTRRHRENSHHIVVLEIRNLYKSRNHLPPRSTSHPLSPLNSSRAGGRGARRLGARAFRMGGRQSRERVGDQGDGADGTTAPSSSAGGGETGTPPSSSSSSGEPHPPTRPSSVPGKPSQRFGPDDTVIIAGGGISGLALAAALQSGPEGERPKVIVLERDFSSEARRQGYGVTLSETNAALAGLGILNDLRNNNTKSNAHWTFRDDGKVLGYYGSAFLPTKDDEKELTSKNKKTPTNLRVPRNKVREILMERLLPGTVRFGSRVVDYMEVSDDNAPGNNSSNNPPIAHVNVTVETVDASASLESFGAGAGRVEWMENETKNKSVASVNTDVIRCSLLVAADGVRSAVQRKRLPNDSLNYLGVVLCTGFTTLRHPLLECQGFYTLDGERARIFTMPFQKSEGGGSHNTNSPPPRSMWQISVRVSEEEARELSKAKKNEVESFVRSVAGSWHAPVPQMIDATDWTGVWCGPLYDRDEPPAPPKGNNAKTRVVAIGDAAHPMSPFKGMGANTALFDAWHLARWLSKASSVPKAISNFQREMVVRAWGKVNASREACVSFHSAVAIEGPIEFAGVDPQNAKQFLEGLHLRNVTAERGGDLETETGKELLEFLTSMDKQSDSDSLNRVKPYAYLRKEKRKEKDVEEEKIKVEEISSFDSLPSDKKRIPPDSVSDKVRNAFAEAIKMLNMAPLSDQELTLAHILVPATSSKKTRPGHDWTSRAALKIAHGRKKEIDVSMGKQSDCDKDKDSLDSVNNADRVDNAFALAMRLTRAVADILETEARERSLDTTHSEDTKSFVASARPSSDGQLFITSSTRALAMKERGLATCIGCGKFYAVHGGGLRQHWARGGNGPTCAAAAAASKNASLNDAEAFAKTGGVIGAAAESSAWRGAGEGRPGPWRESLKEMLHEESGVTNRVAKGVTSDIDTTSVAYPSVDDAPCSKKISSEIEKLCRKSPGLAAAAVGDVCAMRHACDSGWDLLSSTDQHGSGALHWAAGGGHVEACAYLVREKRVPVDATRRKDGRAPLHWACRNGRLATCQWLIEHGAQPNSTTYDEDTPFNLAVWKGHLHVARWLVSLGGVDPGKRNKWGCNALLWACIASGGGDNMSAKQSPLPTVKWLVDELNVPSDVVNVNGHCAIHKCAIYGHCDVIDWLVETNKCGGCSEHWGKDDRGSDPSELAMTNGFHELSAKLRKMGDAILHLPVVYTGDVNVE